MVQVILFDVWGTLVEQGVWSPIKQVRSLLHIRLPLALYVTRMERAMMTAPFSQLPQAFAEVGKEFNIPISEPIMDQLVGLWNSSWIRAQLYEDTVSIITELKHKYKVCLIATTDNFSVPRMLEKLELQDLFDEVFFSYEMGAIKTDPLFFSKVLEKLQVSAHQCVVVGDSLHSDIFPAKEKKMHTVLLDRRNQREYHPKIKSLRDLSGVLDSLK